MIQLESDQVRTLAGEPVAVEWVSSSYSNDMTRHRCRVRPLTARDSADCKNTLIECSVLLKRS